MSRWINVKPNHIPELLSEPGIVGELELAIAMRLETMGSPDAPYRTGADAGVLGHHGGGPMGRLDGWVGKRQVNHPSGHVRAQWFDPGRARLVAQQPIDALVHKALLPAPDAGFGGAGLAHDLGGAVAIRAQQHDGRSPDVFLSRVPVAGDSLKAEAVRGSEGNGDARAHATASHASRLRGIFKWTLLLGGDH